MLSEYLLSIWINENVILGSARFVVKLVIYRGFWLYHVQPGKTRRQRVGTKMHFSCLKIISSWIGHLFKWEPVSAIPKNFRKGNGWGCECVARMAREKGVDWDWEIWGSQTAHTDLSFGSDSRTESQELWRSSQQIGALFLPNTGSRTCQEEAILPPGGQPGAVEFRMAS